MMEMLLKVSAKGQITLPTKLRKEMGLKPGDSVFITQRDDEFVLTPITVTLFDLIGSIPVDGPQDFEKIREETKKYVAEKVMESLQAQND